MKIKDLVVLIGIIGIVLNDGGSRSYCFARLSTDY